MVVRRKKFRYQGRLPDGSRISETFYSAEDLRRFTEDFIKKRARVRAGLIENIRAPLLRDYAKIFLSEREQEVRDKKITHAFFDTLERHCRRFIIPDLGHLNLDAISTPMLEDFLRKLGAGSPERKPYAIGYRNRIAATLKLLFKSAKRRLLITVNPASDLELGDEQQGRAVTYMETADQLVTWVGAAYEVSLEVGTLEMILANVGPRIGQALPLRWKDFDFENRSIWMGRTWEQSTRTIQERTKGRRSYESFLVPMNDALHDALLKWREATPYKDPDHHLFTRSGGLNPVSMETLRDWHDKVRARTGMDFAPHALRHSVGSHVTEAAGDVRTAQALLGHKSQRTTEGFYAHRVKVNLREKANIFQVAPAAPKASPAEATAAPKPMSEEAVAKVASRFVVTGFTPEKNAEVREAILNQLKKGGT